ncbi:unnamed protein product [Mytilus edulis]|uniref:Uncharacterized protein n=1 Tax=Mytilus edulis TaxID=6550 RepID=A0A8S3R801_MYTED|nr:unnamed protein product [Mytilus edulis]
MIYTIQGDTKSSLSDTDGSMKPAEIEKNKLVDDEEVVNQRKTQQRFGNEFPDTENMQSRDQSPPLQELNTKKDTILAKPENIKEKYNDQWCENLLDEGRMNETLENSLSSSYKPTQLLNSYCIHNLRVLAKKQRNILPNRTAMKCLRMLAFREEASIHAEIYTALYQTPIV